MKCCTAAALCLCLGGALHSQDFDPTPVRFVPVNTVEFKLNQPIVHLDVNNYVPSIRAVSVGQPVEFRFFTRQRDWTRPSDVFLSVRWDKDLDAGNGLDWSGWETDQTLGHYAPVGRTFTAAGKYTVTFELKLHNILGQEYTRQKQYDIYAVPVPTAVYADRSTPSNHLYYWAGVDGVCDKPCLLAEGFDPMNTVTPGLNYALGFDLIQKVRSKGHDVFIMEWGDGGAPIESNGGVLLGAARFIHSMLNGREAAVQLVGVSMGGLVARYALAWAEDQDPMTHPGRYIDHYVNTFISYDAPQQGAHINKDLQEMIRENGSFEQKAAIESPAAKEMLYRDVCDATGSMHDRFYSVLRSLNDARVFGGEFANGYPHRCADFGISNGCREAAYPALTTKDLLAQVKICELVTITDFFSIREERSVDIPAEARDIWAGSTFTEDLTKLYSEGYKSMLDLGFSPIALRAAGNWRFRVFFNPVYIPTESALDLESYSRTAGGSLLGGASWFEDTLSQAKFCRHDELPPQTQTKILEWLESNIRRPYLGRPDSLASEAVTHRQVCLSFIDRAAFEDGFAVERKCDGGVFSPLARIAPNSHTYTDYCVDPGATYSYRIRATSKEEVSEYSDTVRVSIPPAGALGAPSGVSARGEPTFVYLQWNPVAGASAYRVYRKVSGESCPDHSTEVTTSSWADPGLPASLSFVYRVTALSGAVEGPASLEAGAAALHCASDFAGGLGSASQRKLVRTLGGKGVPGRLYLVYESGGGSYFTWYDEGSGSWDREHVIGGLPSASESYRCPALVPDSDGSSVGIAYQELIGGVNRIRYDLYDPWYNTINSGAVLDTFFAAAGFEAMPAGMMTRASTGRPSLAAFCWRTNSTLFLGLGTPLDAEGGINRRWSKADLSRLLAYPMAGALHMNLIVTPPAVKNYYQLYLVWEDPCGIHCAHGIYPGGTWPPEAPLLSWESDQGKKVFDVATNSGTQSNSNPVATMNGAGNIVIAWECRDNTSGAQRGNIKVQVRYASILAAVQSPAWTLQVGAGASNYACDPALTDYRSSLTKPNDLTLAWHTQSGGLFCSQFVNGSWGRPYVLDASGRRAVIESCPEDPRTERFIVVTSAGGPPHTLTSMPVKPSQPPPAPLLSWTSVAGNGVKNPLLFWSSDRSAALRFTLYRYTCPADAGDCAQASSSLALLTTGDTSYIDRSVTLWTKSGVPTQATYYYVVAWDASDAASVPSNRVRVLSTSTLYWKRAFPDETAPEETSFEACYPNPFNPSTVINYRVASPGRVRISVYDILGREVERLVDGEQSPGFYSALWNAARSGAVSGGVASGVYCIDMTASDGSGTCLYHAIRRVLFVR